MLRCGAQVVEHGCSRHHCTLHCMNVPTTYQSPTAHSGRPRIHSLPPGASSIHHPAAQIGPLPRHTTAVTAKTPESSACSCSAPSLLQWLLCCCFYGSTGALMQPAGAGQSRTRTRSCLYPLTACKQLQSSMPVPFERSSAVKLLK